MPLDSKAMVVVGGVLMTVAQARAKLPSKLPAGVFKQTAPKKKARRRANRIESAKGGTLKRKPAAPKFSKKALKALAQRGQTVDARGNIVPLNPGNPWDATLKAQRAATEASRGKVTVNKTKKRIAAGRHLPEPSTGKKRPDFDVDLPDAEVRGVGVKGIDEYESGMGRTFRPTKKRQTAAEKRLAHREAQRRYRERKKHGKLSGSRPPINRKANIKRTNAYGSPAMQVGSLGR